MCLGAGWGAGGRPQEGRCDILGWPPGRASLPRASPGWASASGFPRVQSSSVTPSGVILVYGRTDDIFTRWFLALSVLSSIAEFVKFETFLRYAWVERKNASINCCHSKLQVTACIACVRMWFLFVSLFFRTNTMKIKIIAHFFKLSPRLCICCCGVWKTVLGLNDLFLRQW